MKLCKTVGKIQLYGTLSITQSGTGGNMSFGELYSTSGRTVHIAQTGTGTINLLKDVTYKTNKTSPVSTISQSGGGTINLTGDFSIATFDVNLTNGVLSLNSSATKLISNVLKVASGVQIDNNGTLIVGTGTGNGNGSLDVTSGGTLSVVLDGSNAALNVGVASADTNTITNWTMTSGSSLGIGFTSKFYNEKLDLKDDDNDGTYTISFEDILVATVGADTKVNATDLACDYTIGDVGGTDSRHWSVDTTKTTLTNDTDGNVVLSGTLKFDSTIDITEGGIEDNDFTDISDKISTNLAISEKDVTLSGDNSYTGKTEIDDVTVTLEHENALGKSSDITTKGTVGLETGGDTVANLPGTISIEDGSLTMSGKYKADEAKLNGGQHDTEWFDVDSKEGNGFIREGGEAYRVVDVSKGRLNVDALDDVTVAINGEEYQLYSDGLAGEKLDYSTYYIKGKHEVAVSEILTANDTDTATEKVVMEHAEGTLTADADMEVQATAGSLSVTNDAKVTGSLDNTTITAEGGEIAAAISGNSSVKATSGTTTLSGENSYTGDSTIDAAELIVTKDGGLVSAGTAGCRKLVLHGELRYFNDLVRSNPVVEMAGIRGMGTNPGRQGFGVEAGATYRINERWSTSANYGFNAMEDSQEHRVNVGASYTF